MPLYFFGLIFYRDFTFFDLETKIWSPSPFENKNTPPFYSTRFSWIYFVSIHPLRIIYSFLLVFSNHFMYLSPFDWHCAFFFPPPPGQTALADHPYPLTVQPCYVVYLAVNLSSDKERPSRVPAAWWGCGLLARALDGFRKILACRNSSQG
jgi:hypothetical protein